jgi:hypothetical protein
VATTFHNVATDGFRLRERRTHEEDHAWDRSGRGGCDHISIAAEVVKAAKAANNDQLAEQHKRWGANADDIAKFLSGANSNWKDADLKNMLHRHLDLTTAEVTSRLKKDWVADEKAYDDGHVHMHMLMFSDALTEGIAKQYPDKFAK